MRVSVIDLDASVISQGPMRARIAAGKARRVDARDLAGKLRIVASMPELKELERRCAPQARGEPELFFIGSGDFHHLTAMLLRRVEEPVTVIHIDNHPDWVGFPRSLNCGGWVSRALELPMVRKVITLGPCSSDFVRPEIQRASLDDVMNGRHEVLPWRHAPSRVWKRYRNDSDGAPARRGKRLHWQELHNADRPAVLARVRSRIPTPALWITIDKDALVTGEAVTNWDQGGMSLDDVLACITALSEGRRIVGADICGDWSEPRFDDAFRTILAWLDHPAKVRPSAAELAVNARSNARLLAYFEARAA